MPSTSIDTVDAAELAELLQFLTNWLASHADHLGASLAAFFAATATRSSSQCIDLHRFTFLLGGNDGEVLSKSASLSSEEASRLATASSRVHEPCSLYRGDRPAATDGLDGFREPQILLRRARGGHQPFRPHTGRRPPDLTAARRPSMRA